ncbi:very short patch repair endonuclease [Bradyrhizobium sp. USDA 326]|uniref:very short patch repair endonuclease n=1 Tax=Bradyrhizobium sp. USDA 326 TaxID=3377726 RepID=UPI003C74B0E2
MDRLTPARRSWLMSRVRGKDTAPEMVVRRAVHALGYRYRLHVADLPGCPDLVFRSRNKVIFVHGCFWHHHTGCRLATIPKTRGEFWQAKFKANRDRDRRAVSALRAMGWKVLIIWQCELRDSGLFTRIRKFLGPRGPRQTGRLRA